MSFLYFFLSICSCKECMLCFISPSLYTFAVSLSVSVLIYLRLLLIFPQQTRRKCTFFKAQKNPIELLCRLFKSLLFQCGGIISSLKVCRIKRHFLITVQRCMILSEAHIYEIKLLLAQHSQKMPFHVDVQ